MARRTKEWYKNYLDEVQPMMNEHRFDEWATQQDIFPILETGYNGTFYVPDTQQNLFIVLIEEMELFDYNTYPSFYAFCYAKYFGYYSNLYENTGRVVNYRTCQRNQNISLQYQKYWKQKTELAFQYSINYYKEILAPYIYAKQEIVPADYYQVITQIIPNEENNASKQITPGSVTLRIINTEPAQIYCRVLNYALKEKYKIRGTRTTYTETDGTPIMTITTTRLKHIAQFSEEMRGKRVNILVELLNNYLQPVAAQQANNVLIT